ncbi:hypothetical protein [Mycobacterium scrofulaceum]|uniref:hypothetical protein n=1 Tax=Mycobacterium scrofulaceum TaxID=1783 RepID=UPI0012EAC568|nr:hypothetical protein [Mycobacterium scrofulaceum]
MPNRSLIAAATIVWSVAVLVAVLFGLPALLTMAGVRVDAGLIVNGLAAIGAFSAAGVAVWVATEDRRERKREREAAAEAQAGLVVAEPFQVAGPGGVGHAFGVAVQNYGTLAILQVAVVRLQVDRHPNLDFRRDETGSFVAALLAPRRDGERAGTGFYFRGTEDARVSSAFREKRITQETMLTATLRFTDAGGRRWEAVFRAAARLRREHNHEVSSTERVSPLNRLHP